MIASIELGDTEQSVFCKDTETEMDFVFGKLFDTEDTEIADYMIRWSSKIKPNAFVIDFAFLEWNEDTQKDERALVSVVLDFKEQGLQIQITDGNVMAKEKLATDKTYQANEIREWVPMQQLIQSACQFILSNDDRLAPLLESLS